jgi:hypothetical protein
VSDDRVRFTLRLPVDLDELIRDEVFRTRRSKNDIIIARLLKSYHSEGIFFDTRSEEQVTESNSSSQPT